MMRVNDVNNLQNFAGYNYIIFTHYLPRYDSQLPFYFRYFVFNFREYFYLFFIYYTEIL